MKPRLITKVFSGLAYLTEIAEAGSTVDLFGLDPAELPPSPERDTLQPQCDAVAVACAWVRAMQAYRREAHAQSSREVCMALDAISLTPDDAECSLMWATLGFPEAHRHDPDICPACCPCCGECWQYMGTFWVQPEGASAQGYYHSFRHRHHPETGHRVCINFPMVLPPPVAVPS
jgi:hypothetical protein